MKKFQLALLCFAALAFVACDTNKPDDPNHPNTATKALKGVFSVSATQQVRFSPGNLQYAQSTDTWGFAAKQYEIIGEANVKDGALADKIDLFGWSGSTGSAKWGVSTSQNNYDYSGDFVDWGKNIGNGSIWRTLSADEWDYLSEGRTNASSLQGVARIQVSEGEFVNGLILLPDNWTCPAGITFKSGYANEYSIEAYGTYQTFMLKEWEQLEVAGAVFLPASGSRNGTDVSGVGGYGIYWSASYYSESIAGCLAFGADGVFVYNNNRYYGQAVRLVQEL